MKVPLREIGGDPTGIRTRVTGVKGRCPNRWTIGSSQEKKYYRDGLMCHVFFLFFFIHAFCGRDKPRGCGQKIRRLSQSPEKCVLIGGDGIEVSWSGEVFEIGILAQHPHQVFDFL